MSSSSPHRRLVLTALGAAALAGPAFAQRQKVTTDDVSMGSAAAPVTLVEYASLSCGHCAHFHNDVFPAFKAKHIDTGKVRFVFRELLFADPNLAMIGGLVARCAGPDRYFDVVKAVFREQANMIATGRVRETFLQIAGSVGLSEAEMQACLQDRVAIDQMVARSQRFVRENGINATPTFQIGQRKVAGVQSVEQLEAFIAG